MDQIDLAVAHLKAQTKPNISEAARLFGVERSTLSRRFRNVTQSAAMKAEEQMILSHEQEKTLVKYVNRLTEWGLPPTPAMLRNFVCDIVDIYPGKSWTMRFRRRWSHEITSRYLKPMDATRKKVDNQAEYRAYFELVGRKIKEYEVLPENMYNMDEKGFLIGFLTKAMRIFSKHAYKNGRLLGNIQDGNREWITLLATICADGTALPPALIYKAKSGNIQDSWVQDLKSETHEAFFSSSPNGWTDNKIGLAWLQQVFDRFTKGKARQGREWRLLFVDGHGSHINMDFLDWAIEHRILVAVYPPHSTHRLQPLDVSMFSPLAIYYSQELDKFLHDCQGLCSLTKRDFFRLFWPAYIKAFTSKNILSAWLQTGISPFDPSQILSIFDSAQSDHGSSRPASKESSGSALDASDWRKIRALVKEVVIEAVTENDQRKVSKLNNTVLAITTENAILKAQNDGYRRALDNEKKRRKRGKHLFEELRAEDAQGATFFSPKKIQAAKDKISQKEQDKLDEKAQKAAQKREAAARAADKRQAVELRKIERARVAREKESQKAAAAQAKLAAKLDKEAGQQLQQSLQASAKKPRRRANAQKPIKQPLFETELPILAKPRDDVTTASGRTTRKPKHLDGYSLDP